METLSLRFVHRDAAGLNDLCEVDPVPAEGIFDGGDVPAQAIRRELDPAG
jgi:hypothetical protein